MRVAILTLVAWATCGAVQAASCDYHTTVTLVDEPVEVHECWDLSKWPADKAQSFCAGKADADGVTTRVIATCPASVASCAGAKFEAPSGRALPADYLAKMPRDVADRVKANMDKAGGGASRYDGLETTVHYYANAGGTPSLDDQRADCESGKRGTFRTAPAR